MPITPLSLEESKQKEKDEEVGFFESALAGVATGLWNIPKGFVSLGAELFDLIGDTDTAKGVEQWFDDVNPFDDEAEARTVGKITQALTQIGIPAVQGYKIGSALATKALQAKTLGFQAALKELEPGSLEKNARALSKLSGGKITVAQAAKQLSENASAGTNTFRNKQLIAGSLETSPEIALKVANIVVNSDIDIENVSKHPDPTKTTGNEKKGNYYYFEKAGPGGEVMGKWDGNKFILPGEKGFL